MSLLPPLMKVDRNGDDFRPLGPALKRVEPEKAPTREELFEAYDHAPAGQPVPPPLVIERFSLCETLESVFQSAVGVKHAIGVAAGLAARHSPWDDEGNLTDPRDQEALNEFYSKMAAAMESATRPPLISYDFGAGEETALWKLPILRQDVSGSGALPPKSDTAKREYKRNALGVWHILSEKDYATPYESLRDRTKPEEESLLVMRDRLTREYKTKLPVVIEDRATITARILADKQKLRPRKKGRHGE